MNNVFKWIPLASGLLVLVLSLTVAVLTVSSKNSPLAGVTSQNLSTHAAVSAANLALSPAMGDFVLSPTVTYPVGIVVDSGGKIADGVDVIINYDPKKVMVVNSQVSMASMFQQYPQNKVDNVKGEIRVSGLTFDPKPVVGIMGTFLIKPLAKGDVTLTIQFMPGTTTQSTIAEHGSALNVLGSVTNAKYTFR